MDAQDKPTYESINARLKQILATVDDPEIPLNDALDLFEEAVQLGMQASSLLEEGIAARDTSSAVDDEEQTDVREGLSADA